MIILMGNSIKFKAKFICKEKLYDGKTKSGFTPIDLKVGQIVTARINNEQPFQWIDIIYHRKWNKNWARKYFEIIK